MLQRYVRTADLDKVYAAVGDVLAGEKPAGWTLRAFKYAYVVWDGAGLTGILIESTDHLSGFQQKLIDAVAPFTVETGTAAAFFTPPEPSRASAYSARRSLTAPKLEFGLSRQPA